MSVLVETLHWQFVGRYNFKNNYGEKISYKQFVVLSSTLLRLGEALDLSTINTLFEMNRRLIDHGHSD